MARQLMTHEEAEEGLKEHIGRYMRLRELKSRYAQQDNEVKQRRAVASPHTKALAESVRKRNKTAQEILDTIT